VRTWEREHRPLGSGWGKPFTSDAEDVEDGHTTPTRKDAQPVGMERKRE